MIQETIVAVDYWTYSGSEAEAQRAQAVALQVMDDTVCNSNLPPSAQDAPMDRLAGSDAARIQDSENSHAVDSSKAAEEVSNGNQTFVECLQEHQSRLNHDFDSWEQALKRQPSSPSEIPEFDWDDVENDYQRDIGVVALKEKEIMDRFEARFKQFMLWMQVSDEREGERAIKRIKTQSAFVQNSEHNLSQKEQHYSDVMEAFQNAMQLLSRQS